MGTKVTAKYDKTVDSGPLPKDSDTDTQETIQKERIRRQVVSRIGPKPSKMNVDPKMSKQLRQQLTARMKKG